MNPEVKSAESINDASQVEEVKVQVNDETIAQVQVDAESSEQWRRIGESVAAFLSDLPDYIGAFFNQYKRPITVIGLLLGAVISVKLLLAILDSINDIPLLAPTFELIGIGYSAWFVYRYLWQASNRKELGANFNAFKNRVLGNTGVDL